MVERYRRFVRETLLVVAGLVALAALVAHAGVNARAAADYRALGVLPFGWRWQAGQFWADAVPPGLARDSGLQPGDRILRIAAEPVGDTIRPGHTLFWRDGRSSRLLRRGQRLSLTVLQDGLLREVSVPLGRISPAQAREVTRIQAMMLPKQIAGFCLWLLGALVLLRRRDAVTRVFFLWCVALALYTASSAVAVFLWDGYPPALITLFRTGFLAGWFFAPALFGHFCHIYSGGPPNDRRRRRLLPGLSFLAPLAAFLWMGLLSPAAIGAGGRLLWSVLAVSWLAALAAGLTVLLRACGRTIDPLRRKQIQLVLAGSLAYVLVFLCTFVGALAGWDVDPTTVWAWLPHALHLVTPIAFAYAILRHRLLDLELVIRRSLVYTALTLCMGGLFIVLQQLAGAVLQARAGATSLPAQTFAAMVVAALFGPAERRLGRAVESLFHRRKLWRLQQLQRLRREIQFINDTAGLEQLMVARVREIFALEHAALFWMDSVTGEYRLLRGSGLPCHQCVLSFRKEGGLADWLARDRIPLEFTALHQEERCRRLHEAEKAPLAALGAALCVPLSAGGRLAGFLTLGTQPDQDLYSPEEKEALLALAGLAAAALRQAELERRLAELEQERTPFIAAPSPALLTSARG